MYLMLNGKYLKRNEINDSSDTEEYVGDIERQETIEFLKDENLSDEEKLCYVLWDMLSGIDKEQKMKFRTVSNDDFYKSLLAMLKISSNQDYQREASNEIQNLWIEFIDKFDDEINEFNKGMQEENIDLLINKDLALKENADMFYKGVMKIMNKKEELSKLFDDFYIGYNIHDWLNEYKKDINFKPFPKIDETPIIPELKKRYEEDNDKTIRGKEYAIKIKDGEIEKIKPEKTETETETETETSEAEKNSLYEEPQKPPNAKGFELLSGKLDRLESLIKQHLRIPEQKNNDIIYQLQHFYDM